MIRLYKAINILLMFPLVLYPQSQDIKFERIMVEDGLPNGLVHDILQDQQGFMWIATEDGLSKYDGYTFTTYRHDPGDSTSLGSIWVSAIHEDRTGGLWFATSGGGLNKFDRDKEMFFRYKYNRNNPESISSNHVSCIDDFRYKGKDVLWIGTSTGLDKLDPETGKFTRYPHTDLGHPYRFVEALVVDTSGNVWVGSSDGGLHKFNPETEQYTHYKNDPNNPNSLRSNLVYSLLIDRTGDLWVGTGEGGLNKFDPESGQFLSYRHDPDDPTSLSNDLIASLFEDKAGMLWVGAGEGLNAFDREKEQFTHYKHDPDDPNSLSDNLVLCIYEDKSGVLWAGTWAGLTKIDPQKSQFSQIRHLPGNRNSLSNNNVNCIYESHYGGEEILWIGTKNGGLNKLNRTTGKYTCYKHNPDDPNSLINNFVYSICEGRSGILWIGTFHGGLNKFNRSTGQFTRYMYDPDDSNSLSCKSVTCIFEDNTGTLWIGTQTGGINKFDPVTEQFTLVGKKMQIIQIYLDKSDVLWFATLQGLKKLDRETEQLTTYWHNPADPNSISHNSVLSIYENKSGEFWIGTEGGGLNLFDRESGKFIHYTVKDGLPHDIITGILEDEQNNLWLATNKGLSKFNPKTREFRKYDHHNGLLSDQYNFRACFKSKDGEMFFGGINGLNTFYPKNLKDNPHIPPVIITDFQIFNEPVQIKKDDNIEHKNVYTLPGHISTIDEIKLSYKENVFSFEFAALDYHSPMKNRYAYKMEGVDPEWVFTDASRRIISYTQLLPGEYVFRVKGSNNDGLWNEEGTTIKITITPPWWKTNLAYTFYIILTGFIVIGVWRFQTNRLRIKHQMEMDHLHAEKLEEVDRLKSRFFANISHEFRTPLTLIEGPVKQMLSGEFKGNIKEQFKIILRNSGRLLQLINQLLDLSKLESGKLKLQAQATEMISLTNGLVQAFESLAVRKKITLKFKTDLDAQKVYVDVDKFEKIINNLLSNAFKFTSEGGEIILDCGLGNVDLNANKNSKLRITNYEYVQISISNTGPGIPGDKIDKIFDRFYQADDSYKKDEQGTGIGLALTKQLVELHHGQVSVESKPGAKTSFTVLLPLRKEHLREEEIVEVQKPDRITNIHDNENLPSVQLSGPNHPEITNQHPLSTSGQDTAGMLSSLPSGTESEGFGTPETNRFNQKTRVLLVEDNIDLRNYIRDSMNDTFLITEAENGEKGFSKAVKEIPDLIISDVMMPKMDGFEFCAKIKSDERTSHIPVILITARAAQEDKIEGLETGADNYITKPFDNKELNIRVKNLIEQRKKLREKYIRIFDVNPQDISVTSADEKFLHRIVTIFENNIANPEYNTEKFAGEIGMSRSGLNKKLNALTDLPTHQFVLRLRLKRAAKLLKKASGNVSEIAYQVGFSNISHFAKAFRKLYGLSPSEFTRQNS